MSNKPWDALWINSTLATFKNDSGEFGLVKNGALAVKGNKIIWVGLTKDLPDKPDNLAYSVSDLQGKCITPGLIDCHTHLVYAGSRYNEFEMRLKGASYQDIAKAGGGIRSTVKATRECSEEELLEQSKKRVLSLMKEGVTTIEIKSGYGLDLETELKILRVAKRLGELLPINIFPTFLGAHALPAEFQGKSDEYIDLVCDVMIPEVAKQGLAKAVDVFCENIAFNLEQTRKVFETAKKYNLAVKCHSEQLSDLKSSTLAAEFGAVSVDHLEFISEQSIEALAKSGTVAVLLPGAYYFLREKQMPPVDLLRKHDVPMAISTDCNPGTSPMTSLLLVVNMACVLFGLTPEEALLGVTRNAAKALGFDGLYGSLEVGKVADLAIWDVTHPAELAYLIGQNPCVQVVRRGASLP